MFFWQRKFAYLQQQQLGGYLIMHNAGKPASSFIQISRFPTANQILRIIASTPLTPESA